MNKISIKLGKREVETLVNLLNVIRNNFTQQENPNLLEEVIGEIVYEDLNEDINNLNYLLEKNHNNKKMINFSLNKISLFLMSVLIDNEYLQSCFDESNLFLIIDVIKKTFESAEVFIKSPRRP